MSLCKLNSLKYYISVQCQSFHKQLFANVNDITRGMPLWLMKKNAEKLQDSYLFCLFFYEGKPGK